MLLREVCFTCHHPLHCVVRRLQQQKVDSSTSAEIMHWGGVSVKVGLTGRLVAGNCDNNAVKTGSCGLQICLAATAYLPSCKNAPKATKEGSKGQVCLYACSKTNALS